MIALGTLITYSHQAAVARKAGTGQYIAQGEWYIPSKGNGEIFGPFTADKIFSVNGREGFVFVDGDGALLSAERLDKLNKAVIVWDQPGSGVVTGLVSKQFGISTAGGGYTNAYGENDYDQGYFSRSGAVNLYMVRWELKGTKFVYVPVWAARPQVL